MKSNKGASLIELTIYIIAMIVVIGAVSTITKYFYSNLNHVTNISEAIAEYTSFTSYITKDLNNSNLISVELQEGDSDEDYPYVIQMLFSDGHINQYIYNKKSIYFLRADKENNIEKTIEICKNLNEDCEFAYNESKLSFTINFLDNSKYSNIYTIKE